MLDLYGLKLDPQRIVSTLSVGERQRIEIVRALLLNPNLLIMDEPTSVLTPQEVEQLFETLRKLAAGGCSILYISHKLHEIIALCDVATILRGGKFVAECDPKQGNLEEHGRTDDRRELERDRPRAGRAFGEEKFAARGLSLPKHGDFGVDAAGHLLFRARRRDSRRRGRRRQRAERIDGGVERRNAGAPAGGDLDGGRRSAARADRAPCARPCAVPEERNGHAAVGDFTLARTA